MDKFSHIDTWVFDLDNTLYNADSHVFPVSGQKMNEFVANLLSLPLDEAARIRHHYYKTYGTTLRGLMTEHGIEPDEFMQHVHDIDLSPVDVCKITQNDLSHLQGRKFIFTNAPRHFADRMVDHLGIRHHFDAIFAIEDAAYWPKPHMPTYDVFLKKHDINPATACMFEDMEVNLRPAHTLGMTTVWFHRQNPADLHPHVHDIAPDLTQWLLNRKK